MPRTGKDFIPFGYGPWPDNDLPLDDNPGGGHYEDGYHHRGPLGTLIENPSDYWLDCMVYPERPSADSAQSAERLDLASRNLTIGVGNATGRKNGPEN